MISFSLSIYLVFHLRKKGIPSLFSVIMIEASQLIIEVVEQDKNLHTTKTIIESYDTPHHDCLGTKRINDLYAS